MLHVVIVYDLLTAVCVWFSHVSRQHLQTSL